MSLVSVVVTLSGKLDIEVTQDMNTEDLQKLIASHWNIDQKVIVDPFVVVSDMYSGDKKVCPPDTPLNYVLKETSMLRVVMPLKPKE